MKVVQLLCLWEPWQRHVYRDTDCLHCKSYGPVRVCFEPLVAGDQKASLASFSVALPIQALRRLPCLGSFSVV